MADIRLTPMKRGDAFSKTIEMRDGQGALITNSASKLKSQVRDSNDKLYYNLIIIETTIPGTYQFYADKTSDWPIDNLFMDVEYYAVEGELPISTPTFIIPVMRDITHG